MKTKGIRILDIKEGKCIPLREILASVTNECGCFWKLLWLDVVAKKNQGKYLVELKNKTNRSENGFLISFESLVEMSEKVFQEIELTIIACKNIEDLCRYENDQEMYETCYIVIEMIDGGAWEIFSKDMKLIEQLEKKFHKTELLRSDFSN